MDARNLSVDTFDSGDTAWMISATILVLMMTTPGIMLYYSGLVRLQNVLSTAMQAYSIACLVTMLWLCFGYSLAFSPVHESKETNEIFGNTQRFWLSNMHSSSFHYLAPTIPESVFCAFHLAFAIISPSLICGAFADRMKFLSLLLCISLWHLLVYCPLAHIMWHQNGWMKDLGTVLYCAVLTTTISYLCTFDGSHQTILLLLYCTSLHISLDYFVCVCLCMNVCSYICMYIYIQVCWTSQAAQWFTSMLASRPWWRQLSLAREWD